MASKITPPLFALLEDVMKKAHVMQITESDIDRLENALSPFGGVLFDGYKSLAPADKRKKALWLND